MLIWLRSRNRLSPSSNFTNPLNRTACLATCSLQCWSHSANCLSRGKNPAAAGFAIVIAAFQPQATHPALDCVAFLILVVHLSLALRADRPGHRSDGVLRINHHLGHPFAQ